MRVFCIKCTPDLILALIEEFHTKLQYIKISNASHLFRKKRSFPAAASNRSPGPGKCELFAFSRRSANRDKSPQATDALKLIEFSCFVVGGTLGRPGAPKACADKLREISRTRPARLLSYGRTTKRISLFVGAVPWILFWVFRWSGTWVCFGVWYGWVRIAGVGVVHISSDERFLILSGWGVVDWCFCESIEDMKDVYFFIYMKS